VQLAEFCRERGIRWLALFGSALRPDFGPDSDIDVLVEFEPGRVPGLFGMARLERELSGLFDGRAVDLRTPGDLSRYFDKRCSQNQKSSMYSDDLVRLRYTLDAAQEALFFANSRTRKDLDEDRQLVLAIVKEVEIIGMYRRHKTGEKFNFWQKLNFSLLG
jgi:predicted nucleotidyltransferase